MSEIINRSFKIPIYFGTLVVIKTDDIVKTVKKYHPTVKDIGVPYAAITFRKKVDNDDKYYAVFQNSHPSIIAHETVHVVNYIFNDCGVDLDVKNDEAQAYFTGWIFNKIYETLNKE